MDELPHGSSSAPHTEGGATVQRLVALVHQSGNDVSLFNVKVVVWAVHVAGNDGRKLAAVLLAVAPEAWRSEWSEGVSEQSTVGDWCKE